MRRQKSNVAKNAQKENKTQAQLEILHKKDNVARRERRKKEPETKEERT